jgi:hypothetical protein
MLEPQMNADKRELKTATPTLNLRSSVSIGGSFPAFSLGVLGVLGGSTLFLKHQLSYM